ncbi:ankyrin repeat protein [Histoplasma capsulatum var. duboisii H88]|uniref:Ankyrin repeat protein n=1 Tax=Ajellomyces capsulatus (strain H88) TaxID=544711 RepID=F0UPV8_AJEC8|nr:ankyrin repeat protein [Histoplasma capsulatum var. duboisii H88]
MYPRYTFDDTALLEWFLKHGANPNKRCHVRDCTPLSFAVLEGSLEVMKILLENGRSSSQGQLLHYAAMRKTTDSLAVLEYIYNKCLEINASNINKLLDQGSPEYFAMNRRAGLGTPLHYAARAGSLDSVQFLVGKGGNPWILDPYRRTACGWAIYGEQEHVAQYLQSLRNVVPSNPEKQEFNTYILILITISRQHTQTLRRISRECLRIRKYDSNQANEGRIAHNNLFERIEARHQHPDCIVGSSQSPLNTMTGHAPLIQSLW